MINGVGWLDDRHGHSPILYDTAPLFVYTDQLLCHCIFICSNVRKWLAYCMRWLLWCFCLLAESYETINHCDCPEQQSCPGIFTELNMYFLSFRIFEQLALAQKSRGCPKFTVLNMYFLFSGVLSKLRLPWKTEMPWNFHLIEYVFFIIHDLWATCACPEKQSLPWKFPLYGTYILHSEFWASYAYPEKQSLPWNFHCIEYVFFIIQDFWATCACPEKQSLPW